MKSFKIKDRVEPESLKIDLSGWSVNTLEEHVTKSLEEIDDHVDKISDIVRKSIDDIAIPKFVLEMLSEILESTMEEGLIAYIGEYDDDDITVMVSVPFCEDGPMYKFRLGELFDPDDYDEEEASIVAKGLRRLADRLDPPVSKT